MQLLIIYKFFNHLYTLVLNVHSIQTSMINVFYVSWFSCNWADNGVKLYKLSRSRVRGWNFQLPSRGTCQNFNKQSNICTSKKVSEVCTWITCHHFSILTKSWKNGLFTWAFWGDLSVCVLSIQDEWNSEGTHVVVIITGFPERPKEHLMFASKYGVCHYTSWHIVFIKPISWWLVHHSPIIVIMRQYRHVIYMLIFLA